MYNIKQAHAKHHNKEYGKTYIRQYNDVGKIEQSTNQTICQDKVGIYSSQFGQSYSEFGFDICFR